jgi:large subunit ribosomal protein L21
LILKIFFYADVSRYLKISYFCSPYVSAGFEKVVDNESVGSPPGRNFKVYTMYAIVDIAGQQFKVEASRKIFVHRLAAEEGSSVEFEKVLLIDNGGKISIGAPVIAGAKVTAKVLSHLKGDKVIVFKKKRRKGYKKKNGHRQYLTQIEIESIVG